MNIAQIEENIQKLIENFSEEEFIFNLLLAYGLPKNTITLLKKGNHNLSKNSDQIILKKKLLFQKVKNEDLHSVIDDLRNDQSTFRHNPRFIIVTDYTTLLAIDTKTQDTLDINIKAIPKHFDFFLPWAGMEKAQHKNENPADVKAAEKMAKLYDEILKDNQFKTSEEIHSLNIFLSRLLFCFFAEDTGIFEPAAFTKSISSHTQADGEDLDSYLNRLFEILNTKDEDRKNEPEYLKVFPYVNGGLFGNKYFAPKFSGRSRKIIIECGELDWSAINPDIFGSMIQAVVHPDQRGGMGMHYTSVPNIMKVIEPLFLNDLREEFEKYHDSKNKLDQLRARLEKIKIFDPACGSGNFLIIAYKEIRKLEMDIFQRIQDLSQNLSFGFSRISLSQFYGIELDDFAHEVAILSLWLAEHQMNVKFKEKFGKANPSLPLKEGGKIICGNATRLNWEEICPKDNNCEIYILGNPPYLGSRYQEKFHKNDIEYSCSFLDAYKNLDYITCWFLKAGQFIKKTEHQFSFVTTNSICQGQQVELLWPYIFNLGLEIRFSHAPFKWSNSAKANAGVTCVIIGLTARPNQTKYIYSEGVRKVVSNINAYLSDAKNIIIHKRPKPLSELPKMDSGSKATDGGHLILTDEEKNNLLAQYPKAEPYVKRIFGADEFLYGKIRWCLWLNDDRENICKKIPPIAERIEKCRKFRLASSKLSTNNKAETAHLFDEIKHKNCSSIIIPTVTSERREYIPFGFLNANEIIIAPNSAIYKSDTSDFGLLQSRIHTVWVKATSGALESRIRYSSGLSYNTFPVPKLSKVHKDIISQHVFTILDEREKHSEKTIAELYDPDKMPHELREAHHNLDLAVERCYRSKPFISDEERLEYLFKLYEDMIANEKGITPCLI